jgi:type II secretory pathway component GspD/PulD (secretin)
VKAWQFIGAALISIVSSLNAQAAEPVAARPVSLTLEKTPLASVIAVVYGDILKEPYMLDESIKQVTVSIHYKDATPEMLRSVLDAYLQSKGIERVQQAGINMFMPKGGTQTGLSSLKPEEAKSSKDMTEVVQAGIDAKAVSEHAYYFRPVHRPAAEIHKVLTPLLGRSGSVVAAGDDGLLLLGEPNRLALARSLMDQFDRPMAEVIVKATVVEYSSSDDDGAGLFGALRLLGDRLTLSIGERSNTMQPLASIKTGTLEAVLSIVSQDSRFSVLDSSSLRIVSGKSGRLTVGQEVPVLSQFTTDPKGNPVQAVQYRTSGLVLDVKPNVQGERIAADVTQTVSSFAVTRTSNIDSPTLLKREFTTSLSADWGEIVFLGGLDERKDSDARSGIFGARLSRSAARSATTLFLILQFQKA